MIEIANEQVVPLPDATAYFPRGRRGRKRAVSTLYRWTNEGVNGVRLEFIQCGSTRCTSVEAIQRFCNRLTQLESAGQTPGIPASEESARLDRELDAAGF